METITIEIAGTIPGQGYKVWREVVPIFRTPKETVRKWKEYYDSTMVLSYVEMILGEPGARQISLEYSGDNEIARAAREALKFYAKSIEHMLPGKSREIMDEIYAEELQVRKNREARFGIAESQNEPV